MFNNIFINILHRPLEKIINSLITIKLFTFFTITTEF